MKKTFFYLFFTVLSGFSLSTIAQEQVGDRWMDNNLSFQVTEDRIRENGIFTFCILDTSRGYCVENLSTGVQVGVYNEKDERLWKGIGSGRSKTLKLAKGFPDAKYLVIRAFKPFVVNKTTGTHIYQDKPIEIKYYIK